MSGGIAILKKRMICLALACLLAVPARAGGAPRGYLALTFDDGPSGSITKTLLDGLRARDVHATFFVCAYRVEQFPDTLVQIAEQGHEIGLHSVCHTYMDEMTAAEVEADLVANREIVTEVSGVSPRLFRPPGGLYSRELTKAAAAEGLSVVLWSVDPRDWDPVSRKTAAQSVVRGARAGVGHPDARSVGGLGPRGSAGGGRAAGGGVRVLHGVGARGADGPCPGARRRVQLVPRAVTPPDFVCTDSTHRRGGSYPPAPRPCRGGS
jgi:hypothetical protein